MFTVSVTVQTNHCELVTLILQAFGFAGGVTTTSIGGVGVASDIVKESVNEVVPPGQVACQIQVLDPTQAL